MISQLKDATPENLEKELRILARRLKIPDLEQALRFPKYFQVETVRLCNSRCAFCAVNQWDKSHPYMDDSLFEKIAVEMEKFREWIEVVAVQKAGEPTLDPKIIPRVRRLKEAGIRRINLSTNASLLDERLATEFLAAGIDEVLLSIDSVDKEEYERVRVGLKFDVVKRNIESFFRLRDELRPEVIIRVRGVFLLDPDSPQGRSQLKKWESFWVRLKKPHDRIYMKRAHNWGNQKDLVASGIAPPKDAAVYHPCILPWSTMNITTSGAVSLCPQDYDGNLEIGDVRTHTIEKIWRNASWSWIRRLHASGERNTLPLCRGCRLFDLDFSLEAARDEEKRELYDN